MGNNNSTVKARLSLRKLIRLLIIGLAIILALLMTEIIAFGIARIKTNETIYLVLLIVFTALILIGLGFYMVFFGTVLYQVYYNNLFKVSMRNFERLTAQKTSLERYSSDVKIYEFTALNDLTDQIETHYKNVVLTNAQIGYSHIDLEYVEGFQDMITYHSFSKYLNELIIATRFFRNAFISLTYEFHNLEKISDEEVQNLNKNIHNVFNYNSLLIADNRAKFEFIVFIPNFDSISKLREDVENVLKNISLLRHTGDGTNIVAPHASVVIYPYSNMEDIIADLRYANRQGKLINFYIPNKSQSLNDNVLHESLSLNYISKYMEQISSISVSRSDISKTYEQLNKVMNNIAQFFNFDRVGYAVYNELDDSYEVKYAYATKGKPLFKENSLLDKDFVDLMIRVSDSDKTYFFSNRNHVNNDAGRYFDRYGISSGYFYSMSSDGRVSGLIYFTKEDGLFIDSYLRQSLLYLSNSIASLIKEIQDKEEVIVTNKRFNDVLKITGYNLYTIEKSSYKLRMVSDSLQDICRDAQVGRICYQALYNRQRPCENCPLKTGNKKQELLDNHLYESTLALNVGRSKEAQILLTPVKEENATVRDRFDKDLLLNSYYSFCETLQNYFSIHGKGYIIIINIDNIEQLASYYTNEEINLYIRRFSKDIRNLESNLFNIYSISSRSIAILLPEAGKVDAVDFVEKIYPLSQNDYMEDLSDLKFNLSYFVIAYPTEYENAYDLIRSFDKKISDFSDDANKNFMFVPDTKYSRHASKEAYILDILDNSLNNNTFSIRLQPMVNKRKKIDGAELLLRFTDSYRSTDLSTFDVIQIAAQNNKLVNITDMLISYIGELYQEHGKKTFDKSNFTKLSLNTDMSYFSDPAFVDKIVEMQQKCEMPSDFLSFEISESEISNYYDDFKLLTKIIERNNIKLVCDNYTGSLLSIEKIKSLGFTGIKIDRSAVTEITTEPSKLYGIKNILEEAKNAGLTATIVGIESMAQYNLLKDDQHDFDLQGYFFYKPSKVEDVLAVLQKNIKM